MRLTHKIGIMGGTFDPIHFGHLRIAWELLERLPLDEVRFIPCATPAHREMPLANVEQRLAMLALALQSHEKLIVDEREAQREGPSYMVDTLKSLHNDFPDASLHLILGMDAFTQLPSWKDWEQLPDYASLVVVQRPAYQLPVDPKFREWSAQQETQGKIKFAKNITQLGISGTQIRNMLEESRAPQYLLPDTVLKYITDNKLYGGQ